MTIREWKQLVREDLFRYDGARGVPGFIGAWRTELGFRFTFLMRTCALARSTWWTRWGIYHLLRWSYRRISVRYGVYIDFTTAIGGGLYLPHPCSIIVNRRCHLGRDCNLSQNSTIGVSNRGDRAGCPTVGDRVYIGPGAVIFGRVSIGDDAAIGANAVVNRDVPDHGVFGGVPARQLSMKGSEGYVNHANSQPGGKPSPENDPSDP